VIIAPVAYHRMVFRMHQKAMLVQRGHHFAVAALGLDNMFHYTDTPESPWWVVDADVKRRARLNCISHLLAMVPYEEIEPAKLKLPKRQQANPRYRRPPIEAMRWVPRVF
jgi:hypothetical protein